MLTRWLTLTFNRAGVGGHMRAHCICPLRSAPLVLQAQKTNPASLSLSYKSKKHEKKTKVKGASQAQPRKLFFVAPFGSSLTSASHIRSMTKVLKAKDKSKGTSLALSHKSKNRVKQKAKRRLSAFGNKSNSNALWSFPASASHTFVNKSYKHENQKLKAYSLCS